MPVPQPEMPGFYNDTELPLASAPVIRGPGSILPAETTDSTIMDFRRPAPPPYAGVGRTPVRAAMQTPQEEPGECHEPAPQDQPVPPAPEPLSATPAAEKVTADPKQPPIIPASRSPEHERTPPAEERARYEQAYAPLKSKVDELIRAARGNQPPEDHPAYIGEGDNVMAFGFEHEGKQYVAKVPHAQYYDRQEVEARVRDLEPGKGVPDLEQLAAIPPSDEDGVPVTERIPGTDLTRVPLETVRHVTTDHLRKMVHTLRTMPERIHLDQRTSNYMLDLEAGFGFIDYSADEGTLPQSLGHKLHIMRLALSQAGAGKTDSVFSQEGRRNLIAYYRVSADLLEKYRDVCLEQPDHMTFASVIERLGETVANRRELVAAMEQRGWA